MKNFKLLLDYRNDHSLFRYEDDPSREETLQYNLFLEAIQDISSESPVMLELGVSHFPTYSRIFNDIFNNDCTNICTEVLKSRFDEGKERFPQGIFYQTYSGKPMHTQEQAPTEATLEGISNIPFKTLLTENNIEYIDMLHIDIQGSEVSLLEELKKENLYEKINHFFISTHPELLGGHHQCLETLKEWGVTFIFSHPTYGGNGDGLIVCKRDKTD